MSFAVNKEDGYYILHLQCKKITCKVICAIKSFIKKHKEDKVALDLKDTVHLDENFLDLLKDGQFSVFGASTDILGYMSLTNTINLVPVYKNKGDFLEQKRKFIKRNFRLIK